MTIHENGCADCEYCVMDNYDTGEGMDCCNVYALPENGAPVMISSDAHDCPFFEWREINGVSKYD